MVSRLITQSNFGSGCSGVWRRAYCAGSPLLSPPDARYTLLCLVFQAILRSATRFDVVKGDVIAKISLILI